jgi:hypothetical protein
LIAVAGRQGIIPVFAIRTLFDKCGDDPGQFAIAFFSVTIFVLAWGYVKYGPNELGLRRE